MIYFVHPAAICESNAIGEQTRVWSVAHVLQNARIGSDCNWCSTFPVEMCAANTHTISAIGSWYA